MKAFIKIALVVAMTTTATSAQAKTPVLENGQYYTQQQNFCGALMENDESTGNLVMTDITNPSAQRPCLSLGKVTKFKKETNYLFVGYLPEIVATQATISQCEPTQSSPKPCDGGDLDYYDTKTGALLLQAGDILRVSQSLNVLNSNSFEVYPLKATWSRGSTVLATGENTDPSNGTTTVLLLTKSQ